MTISIRDNIQDFRAKHAWYQYEVINKAIPRALNRTAEMARTAASREMRDDGYAFTASEIKQAISIWKASQGNLVSTLKVRRKVKSLMAFGAKQTKDGVMVKVHGQRKLIKGAFIAQLRNGVQGVYVEDKAAGKTVLRFAKQYKRGSRGGWHDYHARKLYGPSVGGSYATARVQEVMERFIRSTFIERLTHEVRYLSR